MTTHPALLPLPLLEAIILQSPLDVLLFDTDLICRYAAPAGGTLFGRTAAELTGMRADEIISPDHGDLHSALQLAAQSATSYGYPSYRYTFNDSTTQALFCWSIRVEPVALHDYRGREEFRGVLVTLADVQDLTDENDHLKRETDRLRRENGRLQRRLVEAERREAAALASRRALREAVRTLVTPAVCYLQALSRRPQILRGQPPERVIEGIVLPGLATVVDAVDEIAGAPSPSDRAGGPP